MGQPLNPDNYKWPQTVDILGSNRRLTILEDINSDHTYAPSTNKPKRGLPKWADFRRHKFLNLIPPVPQRYETNRARKLDFPIDK